LCLLNDWSDCLLALRRSEGAYHEGCINIITASDCAKLIAKHSCLGQVRGH